MKIKQQRSIKEFLETEYPSRKAEEIFNRQSSLLTSMIKSVMDEDGSRFKTLEQTILPRIALYKALGDYTGGEEKIKIMRRYMIDIVAAKTTTLHRSTQTKGKGWYKHNKVSVARCVHAVRMQGTLSFVL